MMDFIRVKIRTKSPSTIQLIQNVRKSALRRRGLRFCFRDFVNSCSHCLRMKIKCLFDANKLGVYLSTPSFAFTVKFWKISTRFHRFSIYQHLLSLSSVTDESPEIKLRLYISTPSFPLLCFLKRTKLRLGVKLRLQQNSRLIYVCRVFEKYLNKNVDDKRRRRRGGKERRCVVKICTHAEQDRLLITFRQRKF